MPHQNSDDDSDTQNNEVPVSEDVFLSETYAGMTLENIIDRTAELEHLNELVMLHIKKAGGLTSTESYFSLVQPVLDLLEVEIRIRYHQGITCREMKLLIQDWIDEEIADLNKNKGN